MNADLIRGRIKELRLTQAEVAKHMGISENSLSRKLLGKRDFRLAEVNQLCSILHIDNPARFFLDISSHISND